METLFRLVREFIGWDDPSKSENQRRFGFVRETAHCDSVEAETLDAYRRFCMRAETVYWDLETNLEIGLKKVNFGKFKVLYDDLRSCIQGFDHDVTVGENFRRVEVNLVAPVRAVVGELAAAARRRVRNQDASLVALADAVVTAFFDPACDAVEVPQAPVGVDFGHLLELVALDRYLDAVREPLEALAGLTQNAFIRRKPDPWMVAHLDPAASDVVSRVYDDLVRGGPLPFNFALGIVALNLRMNGGDFQQPRFLHDVSRQPYALDSLMRYPKYSFRFVVVPSLTTTTTASAAAAPSETTTAPAGDSLASPTLSSSDRHESTTPDHPAARSGL